MLRVYVDEAAAFDMLAILHLKAQVSGDWTAYNSFLGPIEEQIDTHTYLKVMASSEYLDLIQANRRVFELIDQIVSDEKDSTPEYYTKLFAITVHNANMKRFHAKKALQAKFFSNDLTEQKTVK